MTNSPRSLGVLALVVLCACRPESDPIVYAIEADRFGRSGWSEPVNLGPSVNSAANEMNAALSPDELSLYFVSTRAGGFGGADIWVARRASVASPWGNAVNLGATVNTTGLEAAPAVSIDGHLLFFSSDRPGGQGSNDIYVARRADSNDDFGWEPAVSLGTDVNTPGFEAGGVYLQSAEDGTGNFYFVRGPNTVALDIYAVALDRDGRTRSPAVPVVELNDANPAITDAHPTIRLDGRELFLHSNRTGSLGASDVFRSTRRSVHESWSVPENVGAPVSGPANESQPTLTTDGRTLIFTSTRTGGLGGSDIWLSTRTSSGH